jgi:hypothetical protein
MAKRNYWSHNTPDGHAPWSFMEASGYSYAKAGENLAFGFSSSDSVLAGWMNSPKHRDNILNPVYEEVGFGLAESTDFVGNGPEVIIVAFYAKPAVVTAADLQNSSPLASQPAIVQTTLDTQPVARLQVLGNGQLPAWSMFVLTALSSVAVTSLVLRHGRQIRRTLRHSEAYILKHPLFDITAVCLAVSGLILSRTAGFIG